MQSPTGVHDLHFTPPGSVDHRATDRLEPIREPNREAKRARWRFAASPTLENPPYPSGVICSIIPLPNHCFWLISVPRLPKEAR